MLTKERCQVRIRDEIAANGKIFRNFTINPEKALFFRENPYMGQADQRLNIA